MLACVKVWATGEPSTYFNIYVPPNNDQTSRDVCLIITALYDSTTFDIVDDGADGDTDDSKSGMLMKGQSYILYLRNNGVNDDAPHAGESATKQDGDYFIITSNKLVFASQATNSNWQHDWLASYNKTSIGQQYVVYSNVNTGGGSNNDINVFAYQDSTYVTVKKISKSATTAQGYTNVDMDNGTIVAQRMLNVGEDLIYKYSEGRNLLAPGETYLIESNKPVTTQYGSLYQNERDGGGYVPSSNGSSSGSLFYFAVPYQANNEQEIRIVSWNDSNNVVLERYTLTGWVTVKTYANVGRLKAVDWVGANFGQTYPNVFRITCTNGKKVSVLEANWMETGSPGTSDMATMASAESGNCAGKDFLIYMPPPGNQNNIKDPFTGTKLSQNVHAYLYAKDSCTVTVKDAYTNGAKINRTYTIAAGRYADVNLTLAQWKSIYNSTGTAAAGPERPYLLINSNRNISVMVSNSNDNWMMYFGSSLEQSFKMTSLSSDAKSIPGDTTVIVSDINITGGSAITNSDIEITVSNGATPLNSVLIDSSHNTTVTGNIAADTGSGYKISFPTVNTLDSSGNYSIQTTLSLTALSSSGALVPNNSIVSVNTTISGYINGTYQQSSSTASVVNNSANTSNYQFTKVTIGNIVTDSIDSWNSCWGDINGDNYPDLLVSNYAEGKANYMYQNNGNGTFTKVSKGDITSAKAYSSISSVYADLDNDGVNEYISSNNKDKACYLYKKNASGNFMLTAGGDLTTDGGYGQTVNVVDYDNDGLLDVFVAEYFPVNMCRIYHNDGGLQFTKVKTSAISNISDYTIGSTWCDYDNDGKMDLFVPVAGTSGSTMNKNNRLFHNEGNGVFTRITTGDIVTDSANTTASTWGDYDNDGFMDLFTANASNGKCMLYHNNGNGSFARIDTGAIVNTRGNWHGCNWVDYDNDGRLDLYVVTNDSLGMKMLYHNEGNGYFVNKNYEVPCATAKRTIGTSWCDYDKDGFPDLYVTTTGYLPNQLFHNNGNSNKWINIKLVGLVSNKNGIGAKVKVKCTIGGQPVWQTREITSTSGIGSQSECNAAFGLGSCTSIDSVLVIWPSGIRQSISGVACNQFLQISEPATSKVSGRIFLDNNNNCVLDSTEIGISNVKLVVNPGNIVINTNDSGKFAVNLPLGNYTVTPATSPYWTPSCNTSMTVNVAAVNTVYAGNDLGNKALLNGTDLSMSIGAGTFRRGFKNKMVVSYCNNGNTTATGGQVSVTFPAGITPTAESAPWVSVNGNTYTWAIPDLTPGQKGYINITQVISTTYVVGNTLSYAARIGCADMDIDTTNNQAAYSNKIYGAIDPNEISVFPVGEGTQGYVYKEQDLTYKIEFENIGNYAAENVYISDVLPEGLAASDIEILQTTHSCNFQLQGQQLQFFFEQINLPFTKEDPEHSTGFVVFRLKPTATTVPGTRILNNADIQFDYELPLNTGNVLNTIYPGSAVAARNTLFVYPNPATTNFTVQAKDYYSGIVLRSMAIKDLWGKVIYQQAVNATSGNIDISALKLSGTYEVEAKDLDGRIYISKIVLQ